MQGFIVRSGLQYGVDFITYSDHMSRVHAEFGVIVQSLQAPARLPWQDLEIINRLSHQVRGARTLPRHHNQSAASSAGSSTRTAPLGNLMQLCGAGGQEPAPGVRA